MASEGVYQALLGTPKKMTNRYPRWAVGAPILYATSALASFGDAMFGYSQGTIASILVQPPFIRDIFGVNVTLEQVNNLETGVSDTTQSITASCLNLTALFAALVAAVLCDMIGRRHVVRLGGIIYLIASIGAALSDSFAVFIFFRCIQGIGVGFLSMSVPIVQTEIAGDHARGRMICIEYICLNSGYLLSAGAGWGLFHYVNSGTISWKAMFIIQGGLAIILIFASFFMPETPRWLVRNGFENEGLQTLADLHGNGDVTSPEIVTAFKKMKLIIQMEDDAKQASWRDLFTKFWRQTLMGVSGQMFAQLNGINAVLFFLPIILIRSGKTVEESLKFSFIAAWCYCGGTVPAMWGVEWSRKKWLLGTTLALIVALSVIGSTQLVSEGFPRGPTKTEYSNVIFSFFCIYLFAFGAGWGPIPWLLPAEVFPMSARAKGAALSTSVNWTFNFLVAFITPIAFKNIQAIYYFVILALVCLSFLFVWAYYRETAHMSLEDIQVVFEDVYEGPRKFVPDFRSKPHGMAGTSKDAEAPVVEKVFQLPSSNGIGVQDAGKRVSWLSTDGEGGGSSSRAGSSTMGENLLEVMNEILSKASWTDQNTELLDIPLHDGEREGDGASFA
ncbi:uncharacterized protein EI90DRAFT_2999241 [Cantharellus anzutake]|uniref:uncharacterized protein n=1 Tax=Cantharellus anzutake TaxID=1750568 RepID=UPI00190524B8|nr:uncharacterized protein EI90DRAFT_2999241 [Cantharellus anzutake]KAF8326663.1 hypothetical protein EI90DRAFT_2999241 [Cantharellus anzutake]